MAPTPNVLSAPGAVSYDSNNLHVGDGTWDFSKNTFLLPNLQGLPIDTLRYNGMGNRFSTMTQYHSMVLAHGILAVIVFLFIVPFSVMIARFYSMRPGMAIKYHAQLHIFGALLLIAIFILGFFSVGLERSLTNPHHGIGVAIFVMFIVQILGGRLIKKITKIRSLRITLHQWLGRAIALLGIVQIPLGLALYGSPLFTYILFAVWMAILLLAYFILCYQSGGRRELYMDGPRSEIGRSEVTRRTRLTESEYFASDQETEMGGRGRSKWLGPLAAGAGIWALMRNRNKNSDRTRSRSPSSRGPEYLQSRRGSSYYQSEKYSDLPPPEKERGGGFMKTLGGMAAAFGAGKLVSGMKRDRHRDEEYSAVSTETPRKYRGSRGAPTDLSSELTEDTGLDGTRTSLIPPSGTRTGLAQARSAADSKMGTKRPITPRPSHARNASRRSFDDSEYSSYVSPSRRPIEERPSGSGGGFAGGILGGLGMGWLANKLSGNKGRKDEDQRLQDEEDLRSQTEVSRMTGDSAPPKRHSRPPPRRATAPATSTALSSEMTESSIEERPPGGNFGHRPDEASTVPTVVPTGRPGHRSRSRSTPRRNGDFVSMPSMPDDPRGVLHHGSEEGPPVRRGSSRRRRAGDRAAAAAAARAEDLADENGSFIGNKERDRNVTLRRLTDEEARASRGRRTSESSMSGMETPTYERRHYRRDSNQRQAEAAAERRAEEADQVADLAPPNPAFGGGRQGGGRAGGPSGSVPAAGHTATSLGSHGTWSQLSPEPSIDKPSVSTAPSAAADNRKRRRQERRLGSSVSRPTNPDMYD